MTQDEFIAQAVIAGKTLVQALALYAVAFPPPKAPEPGDVIGFRREVFPDGRIVETKILGDGRERVTQQRQADE